MFPTAIPRPEYYDDGPILVVIRATQKVNFPAGVGRAKITATGGGAANSTNAAGHGAGTYVCVIDVDPTVDYTAVVGSGASATAGGASGGDSMFIGRGLTPVVGKGALAPIGGAAQAQSGGTGPTPGYQLLGGLAMYGGTNFTIGGTSAIGSPFGQSGAAGQDGGFIIEYKGRV